LHDDGPIHAGVFGQLAQRGFARPADDFNADAGFAGNLEFIQRGLRADQRDAAAGNNAFLDGRARRMQRILDAGFLFLHFRLGGGPDIDHGHTAGQLRQALLELLAVVVGGRLLDLPADLADPALDVGGLARSFHNRGVLLVHVDPLGAAHVRQGQAFQLDAQIFADELAAGQDRDVFHHGLAAIAKAGALHRTHLQGAAQLVHHQRRQRFAFDVFGDDQQGLAALGHVLQHRQQILQVRDLLFEQQDIGVFQDDFHRVRLGHEIRAQIALVELHAFHDIQGRLDALGFLDRDRPVLADLVHRLRDDFADGGLAVGRDGADLRDFFAVLHLLALLFKGLDHRFGRRVDAPA